MFLLAPFSHAEMVGDIPHIEKNIQLDGKLDEAVWKQAKVIELSFEIYPAINTPADKKTTAYLYEDGKTLFVGIDARDSNPDEIRSFFRDRDNLGFDDNVSIYIDPFNQRRIAYFFGSNALGIQTDGTIDDLNDEISNKWDGIWSSAGTITETGYIIEMAIPFRLMRIPEGSDIKEWAIDFRRFDTRKKFKTYSNTADDRNFDCRVCQYSSYQGFKSIEKGTDLQLIPSITLQQQELRDITVPNSSFDSTDNSEIGLDARWGVTDNSVLNATFNPDFSQIEADIPQSEANIKFVRRFKEKRSFFLEGDDLFSTPSQLIYTRTMVDPNWGLKFTGENENSSWGVLAVNDEETTFLDIDNQGSNFITLDQESNNLAARYNRDITDNLRVGTLVTNRTADNYSNQVVSLDTRWAITSGQRIFAQIMRSDSDYSALGGGDFDDTAYKLLYEYTSEEWEGKIEFEDFGEDFRADLGLLERVGHKTNRQSLERIWYFDEGIWSLFTVNGSHEQIKAESGEVLEDNFSAGIFAQGPYNSRIAINVNTLEQLENSTQFDLNFIDYFASFSPMVGLDLEISGQFGDAIDFSNTQEADLNSVSIGAEWNVNRHLRVELSHTIEVLDVSGGELFNLTIDDLRFVYQFDGKSFIRLTSQYFIQESDPSLFNFAIEEKEESLNLELLYSYKLNTQTVFFAGYNSGRARPNAILKLKEQEKTAFLKFTYSWIY